MQHETKQSCLNHTAGKNLAGYRNSLHCCCFIPGVSESFCLSGLKSKLYNPHLNIRRKTIEYINRNIIRSLSLSLYLCVCVSLSLFLSLSHTHARTHANTHGQSSGRCTTSRQDRLGCVTMAQQDKACSRDAYKFVQVISGSRFTKKGSACWRKSKEARKRANLLKQHLRGWNRHYSPAESEPAVTSR